MKSVFPIITACIAAVTLLGCSDKPSATSKPAATLSATDSAAAKPNARVAQLKDLETRAAQSDAGAQLALAKMLLDGTDVPPDYGRAKELLLSASARELPEAILGLWILRAWQLIDYETLPDSKTLQAKAFATGDPFVTQFIFRPSFVSLDAPPDSLVKAASSGYPLANAKLAKYYGLIGWYANMCKSVAVKELRKSPSGKEGFRGCEHALRVSDATNRAVSYATAIMDAKEVDADKQKYWTSLIMRIGVSRSKVSDLPPLAQMRNLEVKLKADPYSSAFADAMGQVGKMLKESTDIISKAPQAATLLKRASELGDSEAQNALGELYQRGHGVSKDFEMAARYFAQSAQQGEADGAKNIGLAFARGEGVERDLVQGYFWLSVAAMNTFSHAIAYQMVDPGALRDKLARSMKPEEIAEAQSRIRDWRPSIQIGPPLAVASGKRGGGGSAVTTAVGGALTKRGTGTAFVVGEGGQAVTNYHVIDGCTELRVGGRDGLAKRVTEDTVNDLALIQLSGTVSASATVPRDATRLRQGEDIVVFGFPLDSVLSSGGNLTPGVVSALTGLGNNTNQVQITAPIQPGSSGSPVMNKKGEVVGVVSMKLSDSKMARATGSIGQNVNFAVSGQTLKTFLDTHKVSYKSGGGILSFEKGTADLADEARKWTLVLECWK